MTDAILRGSEKFRAGFAKLRTEEQQVVAEAAITARRMQYFPTPYTFTDQQTVPQIFINGKHIGNAEELEQWARKAA